MEKDTDKRRMHDDLVLIATEEWLKARDEQFEAQTHYTACMEQASAAWAEMTRQIEDRNEFLKKVAMEGSE